MQKKNKQRSQLGPKFNMTESRLLLPMRSKMLFPYRAVCRAVLTCRYSSLPSIISWTRAADLVMSFRNAARYRVVVPSHKAWFSANTAAEAVLAKEGMAANIPSKILAPRFPLARH